MARNAGKKARKGPGETPALRAPETAKVKALQSVAGFEWSCQRGDHLSIPIAEAERLVAAGVMEYALSPVERSVLLLKSRGCGIALPATPDAEVQAAVLEHGVPTAEI